MKQTLLSIIVIGFLFSMSVSASGSTLDSVITRDANLRSGPGTDFTVITALYAGTRVSWIKSENQWVQVNIPALKKQGWIHFSLVKRIPSTSSHILPQSVIGIIDIQRVLNESIQGIAAKEKLDHIQKSSGSEQIENTEKQIISGILLEIEVIVTAYAQKNGFTHILNTNSGAVFYHDTVYDITNDIIREYNEQLQLNN